MIDANAGSAATGDVVIRALDAADERNFVLKSWLETYRHSAVMRYITNDVYYKNQYERITAALSRSNTIVATSNDVLLGFCTYELPNILHYIYVKTAYRRFGVATKMLNTTGVKSNPARRVTVTHLDTRVCYSLKLDFDYDPFLLK